MAAAKKKALVANTSNASASALMHPCRAGGEAQTSLSAAQRVQEKD
jgi:hypothetical protein